MKNLLRQPYQGSQRSSKTFLTVLILSLSTLSDLTAGCNTKFSQVLQSVYTVPVSTQQIIAPPYIYTSNCNSRCNYQTLNLPYHIDDLGPSMGTRVNTYSDAGSYTINFRATSPGDCSDTFAVQLYIGANPCGSTSLSAKTLTDQTIYLDNGAAHTYNVGYFTDTAGVSAGDQDLCGNRAFAFSHSPSGGTLVTNNGQNKFDIEANKPTFNIGTYSVTVTVTLVNDSSVSRVFSFNVDVRDPCENAEVTFSQTSANMEVIIGSTSPFEQNFLLSNSRADQNSDIGYCGDYDCSMNESSGQPLNSFLSGTFSQVAGSPSANEWVISLDPASATSTDVSYTSIEVTCQLVSYPTSTSAQESFRVAVHEITIDFPDMHVLINGQTYTSNEPSWILTPAAVSYNYADFTISSSQDTSLSYNIHPNSYDIGFSCTPIEADFLTAVHHITISIKPVTQPSGDQEQTLTVPVIVYSYLGTFTISSPVYYILTGSTEPFAHSIIEVNNCQADYSAALMNTALMSYDPLVQTLSVSSSDQSFKGVYSVEFEAELKQCDEPRLEGQSATLDFVVNAIAYDWPSETNAYIIGSVPYIFTEASLTIDPAASPLTFSFSAIESGTGTLPSDWISATPVTSSSTIQFTLQTEDMSLQSTKVIEKQATCNENGQLISIPFDIWLYSYAGFEVQDRVYVMNGQTVSFSINNVVTEPEIHTVEIPAFSFDTVLETSPGVYSSDPAGNPTYITSFSTTTEITFEIVPDVTMVAGTQHLLHTWTVCQQILGSVLTNIETNLVGQKIEKYFSVTLYELAQPFEVQNQEYTLDGSTLTIPIEPLVLFPGDHKLTLIYKVTYSDDQALNEDFMTFDQNNLELTLKSSDQSLSGEYQLKVDVSSDDQRWLDQTITALFTITVEKSPFSFTSENNQPIIKGLADTPLFTLPANKDSQFYDVPLGQAFDPDGDEFEIDFDNEGNDFVRLEVGQDGILSLKIDDLAPRGIFSCTVELTDENEAGNLVKSYTIYFVIPDQQQQALDDDLTDEAVLLPFEYVKKEIEPYINVRSIDQQGSLLVEFSEEMEIIRELWTIDETVLLFDIETLDKEYIYMRDFYWNVTMYNSTNCIIQFTWDYPPWISSTTERDFMIMHVLNKDKFFRPTRQRLRLLSEQQTHDEAVFRGDGSWQINVPPQMKPDQVQALTVTAETTGTIVQGYTLIQIILHPLIMMSLSMLWSMINGIQILAYFMLLNLSIPANVLIVKETLYEVATFDILPLDFVTDALDSMLGEYDNNRNVSLGAQAMQSGFDRTNPIINMILPLVIVFSTFAILGLLVIISKMHRKLKQFYLQVKEKVFWNHFIRLYIQEYIVICLSCLIKLYAFDLSNFYEILNSILALILFMMTVVVPLIAILFLLRQHKAGNLDRDHPEHSSFRQKWGSLILDLQIREKESLFFTTFFMVRRWLVALTIVTLVEYNWAQVQLTVFMNVLVMIYQGYFEPYILPEFNRLQATNESLITLCSYFLFLYTDFLSEKGIRYDMGWINIVLIGLAIILNMAYQIQLNIKNILWAMKIRKLKKAYRKAMANKLKKMIFKPTFKNPSVYQDQDKEREVNGSPPKGFELKGLVIQLRENPSMDGKIEHKRNLSASETKIMTKNDQDKSRNDEGLSTPKKNKPPFEISFESNQPEAGTASLINVSEAERLWAESGFDKWKQQMLDKPLYQHRNKRAPVMSLAESFSTQEEIKTGQQGIESVDAQKKEDLHVGVDQIISNPVSFRSEISTGVQAINTPVPLRVKKGLEGDYGPYQTEFQRIQADVKKYILGLPTGLHIIQQDPLREDGTPQQPYERDSPTPIIYSNSNSVASTGNRVKEGEQNENEQGVNDGSDGNRQDVSLSVDDSQSSLNALVKQIYSNNSKLQMLQSQLDEQSP